MQEYFQPKIGRKITIFSLGRKNNILTEKKSVCWLDVKFYVRQKTELFQPNDISEVFVKV